MKENFQDLCLDEPASTEVAGYNNITTDVQTARTVVLSSYTTWSRRTTEIEEVKEKPIRKSRRKGLAAGKSFSIPGNMSSVRDDSVITGNDEDNLEQFVDLGEEKKHETLFQYCIASPSYQKRRAPRPGLCGIRWRMNGLPREF